MYTKHGGEGCSTKIQSQSLPFRKDQTIFSFIANGINNGLTQFLLAKKRMMLCLIRLNSIDSHLVYSLNRRHYTLKVFPINRTIVLAGARLLWMNEWLSNILRLLERERVRERGVVIIDSIVSKRKSPKSRVHLPFNRWVQGVIFFFIWAPNVEIYCRHTNYNVISRDITVC